MTIWEYIKQADHPWFNTGNYEWWQIAMFTLGAVLWVAVYLKTLHRLKTNKEVDIPLWAVTLNFTCEIVTAIFFVPDMGLVLVIAYWAWLVLDTFIIIGLLRYGYKQVRIAYFKKNIKVFFAVWIPLAFALQYNFILGYDLPMAPLDSFIINLVMSICFVYMIFLPSQFVASKLIGWCKFLGTGIIGVMFFTKYPSYHFLTTLYVACAIFDILYLYLVYNKDVVKKYAPEF